MKKFIQKLLPLLLLTTIMSCSKDDPHQLNLNDSGGSIKMKQSNSKTNYTGPTLLNETYNLINLTHFEVTDPDWNSEFIGSADLDQVDIDNITSDINTTFNSTLLGNNNFAFCFFMSNSYNTNGVTSSNIKGISVIELNSNNKIEHRFLRVSELGVLSEDLSFKSEFDEISTRDMCMMLFESNDGRPENASFFYTTSFEYYAIAESKFTELDLSKIIIDNAEFLSNTPGGGGGGACSMRACGSSARGYCSSKGGRAFECVRPQDEFCPLEAVLEMGLSIDPNFDPNASTPLPTAYSFRDDILEQSTIGIKYINYYRQLGEVFDAFETLKTNNFYEHLDFATDMFLIADRMMDLDNDLIVIDDDIKSNTIDFIDDYRLVTSNDEYQQILNDIETDINYFHGMKRSEIETELNN